MVWLHCACLTLGLWEVLLFFFLGKVLRNALKA